MPEEIVWKRARLFNEEVSTPEQLLYDEMDGGRKKGICCSSGVTKKDHFVWWIQEEEQVCFCSGETFAD